MAGHGLATPRAIMHDAVPAGGWIDVSQLTQRESQSLHAANQKVADGFRSFASRFIHDYGHASDAIGFIDLRHNSPLVSSLNRIENLQWSKTELGQAIHPKLHSHARAA